jgi:hypothetical protein
MGNSVPSNEGTSYNGAGSTSGTGYQAGRFAGRTPPMAMTSACKGMRMAGTAGRRMNRAVDGRSGTLLTTLLAP